jgi:hypothetical protein
VAGGVRHVTGAPASGVPVVEPVLAPELEPALEPEVALEPALVPADTVEAVPPTTLDPPPVDAAAVVLAPELPAPLEADPLLALAPPTEPSRRPAAGPASPAAD